MGPAAGSTKGYARQGWVAFCSGWWLAGLFLGLRLFLDVVARPSTGVLEAVGVSVVMGGLLPGGTPFWYAAEVAGVRGLPVGFTGLLIGGVIALAVWVTLPFALSLDVDDQADLAATRQYLVVAAIPYVAAAAGLAHLFRASRARGLTRLRATVLVLASAVIAYLVGAAVVFTLGAVFLL